jgi:hypothetical protein
MYENANIILYNVTWPFARVKVACSALAVEPLIAGWLTVWSVGGEQTLGLHSGSLCDMVALSGICY